MATIGARPTSLVPSWSECRSDNTRARDSLPSELELEQGLPDAVVRIVRALLPDPVQAVSPWWLAGLESLGTPVELEFRAQEAIARPRRTRGAERA